MKYELKTKTVDNTFVMFLTHIFFTLQFRAFFSCKFCFSNSGKCIPCQNIPIKFKRQKLQTDETDLSEVPRFWLATLYR